MSKKNKNTLLAGHKRYKNSLISPYSVIEDRVGEGKVIPTSSSDRFPELIWISLILHHFGLRDGVSLLSRIAGEIKGCSISPCLYLKMEFLKMK